MKRENQRLVVLMMGVLFCLLTMGLSGDSAVSALDRTTYKSLKTFNEILDIVEKNYVEPVDAATLLQGAIQGMMKSLDPHSTFMTPEMYKELEVETRGSFGGIGIEITIKKDVLTVVTPIEDTPAYQADIKPGDQIVKIDGKSTKDISILEAVKKLRGPKDSKVTITIMRESFTKPKDVTLTRSVIKIKSVKSKIYDETIGYIRLSAFQERSDDELKKAAQDIQSKAKPLKGLVFDLRNNAGGLLSQAVETSEIFLKAGIIVTTKGRTKGMEAKYVAKDDGKEMSCPIVVLVNEGTASAAEIVAGALQDNGKALIMGTPTFGKGSVQTVIPLDDGSAIKLTTAKYYTPKGRSIQAEGIQPDILVKFIKPAEDADPKEDQVRERDLKGHIKSTREENTKTNDGPAKKIDDTAQDNQLKTAIDTLKSWDIFNSSLKAEKR